MNVDISPSRDSKESELLPVTCGSWAYQCLLGLIEIFATRLLHSSSVYKMILPFFVAKGCRVSVCVCVCVWVCVCVCVLFFLFTHN